MTESSVKNEPKSGDDLISEVRELRQQVGRCKQIEAALKKAHDELEARVSERTTELVEANERLERSEERLQLARRAAEAKLEEQQIMALRGDRLRALGEMAAGMAHELNQPLMGVRGIAEHLLIGMDRGWEVGEETLRKRLEGIVDQAERMDHIIRHVRTFAAEADKPEMRAVRVNEVVRSSAEMIAVQMPSRDIEMKLELGDGLPEVFVNPFSLEEVLLNLLRNAWQAIEEAEASPHPRQILLRTTERRQEGRTLVVLEVRDSGVGMEADILERVFDPFYTTKGPERGTGLGLSVALAIVKSFDGTIELTSKMGDGTSVRVLLPAQEPRDG